MSAEIQNIVITYTIDVDDRKARAAARALRQEVIELVKDYDGLFACEADVN